jgi:hypothetical protein
MEQEASSRRYSSTERQHVSKRMWAPCGTPLLSQA